MSDQEGISEVIVECSFCSKNSDEVDKLIAGHHNVYICDECVAIRSNEVVECSFCFKKFRKNEFPIPSESEAQICKECVAICDGIIRRT